MDREPVDRIATGVAGVHGRDVEVIPASAVHLSAQFLRIGIEGIKTRIWSRTRFTVVLRNTAGFSAVKSTSWTVSVSDAIGRSRSIPGRVDVLASVEVGGRRSDRKRSRNAELVLACGVQGKAPRADPEALVVLPSVDLMLAAGGLPTQTTSPSLGHNEVPSMKRLAVSAAG